MWVYFWLLSLAVVCLASEHKQHCRQVTAVTVSRPFVGRWYVYAATTCTDSSSTQYRLGLFNNKVCRCEVLDFYSNGRSYDYQVATHFIDSVWSPEKNSYDSTVFDYYTLNSTYRQSDVGIYVAQADNYYKDKQIKEDSSSDSSSSSSEEKKKQQQQKQSGRYQFFFACLADTDDYKIFYVCNKYVSKQYSSGKPVLWILTRTAVPTASHITSIRSCLSSNNVDYYDSFTFINHTGCSYAAEQTKYGEYSLYAQ